MSAAIEDRYGRTRQRRTRERRILWFSAALFAIILAAWVIWAGLDGTKPLIEARDLAYTVVDDDTVTVTYQVSVPAGTPTSCAVQALSENFTVVGWKVVDLPASEQYTRVLTESLRTSELATTGLIYRCWLT